MNKRVISLIFGASLLGLIASSQAGGGDVVVDQNSIDSTNTINTPPYLKASKWADSVLNSLTADERIGQLFMVAAYSNKGASHSKAIEKLIKDYKIGGLIFMQGGPLRQAHLQNKYQAMAKTPLLIAMDAEWGVAMRLDSTEKFPRQMTLGAIQNDSLIYAMGEEVAQQFNLMGMHVNFAPVVDVNNNRNNPVINSRSFGEDRDNVARKGIAYMHGMQDHHVLANAKHFPGHGDTNSDSHETLPVIKHNRSRLDSIELYPFRKMIDAGLGSMMIAHLYIPSLDSTKNLASTLSKPIVTDLLRREMGFEGIVFTDALNMKGVSAFYEPGEVNVKALLAGNDMLLFAADVPTAITKIKAAIKVGEITQEEIDQRCLKLLKAKAWVGLDRYQPVATKGLVEALNSNQSQLINAQLVEASLTLLRNKHQLLPLQRLDTLKIASLVIGDKVNNQFQQTLNKYTKVDCFAVDRDLKKESAASLKAKLKNYNLIIVSLHHTHTSPRGNFGVRNAAMKLIRELSTEKKVIADVFASPYSLSKFSGAEHLDGLIVSYEDNELAKDRSAQLIFGGVAASGKLPVTASNHFKVGDGIEMEKATRLKYTIPEEVGIEASWLQKIDSIALNGVKNKAYPGCQVLVAKEGKVIYQKSFGHHTYEGKRVVKNSDIYDLASITKIVASTSSLMRLKDEGKVNLDLNLCDYLPEMVDTTDYINMNLRAMLAHQAGLVSWIPFYTKTLHKGQPRFELYSLVESDIYSNRVAEKFYMNKHYVDTMYARILNTSVNGKKKYRYSDLGYYFFHKIIEKQGGVALNQYVDSVFYRPLGLQTMGYHPRKRHQLDVIVPTEYDMIFRKQLIHGDVHDPGAAMLGGVGGHAGVFSNANDLAVMMQLFLNKGSYGGNQYIQQATIKEFTRCQYCKDDNRRGAGFDKPVHGKGGPTCECVSYESFGHSGFTGTIAWADPNEQVVYVFLSNRIYPDAENWKLIKMDIRTNIQQVIYDAIEKSKVKVLSQR